MGMSKGAWILLIVLVGGVLGGLAFYKSTQRTRIGEEARISAHGVIDRPGFDGEREYMRGLIDQCHAEAFGASFESGGLTVASFFDEELYFHELWTRVEALLENDGKSALAGFLPHFEHHLDDRPGMPAGSDAM